MENMVNKSTVVPGADARGVSCSEQDEFCTRGCDNEVLALPGLVVEEKNKSICNATVRNWERLGTKSIGRLTTRANKRESKKRVLPSEYISNKNNIAFIQSALDYIDENRIDILSAMFSLGVGLLKKAEIYQREHVKKILSEYSHVARIEYLAELSVPNDEFDVLGLLYQAYLQEGKKNSMGSYYTPPKVVYNMVKDFDFSNGESFFDPCCGSGAFLLSVNSKYPEQIFGVDNDCVAVFIAKVNMLLKYRDIDFIPQIYCLNFLTGYSILQQHPVFKRRFDYIATNPPWGAMENNCDNAGVIKSKETFSCFFVRAFEQLKNNGTIRFLFPQAILNVKVHKDIRKFILDKTRLVGITMYNGVFSGVTTKYVDIKCSRGTSENQFKVYSEGLEKTVDIKTVYETDNLIFNLLSKYDASLVRIAKEKGKFSLSNSVWALGVVTGDNKGKLSEVCLGGMEKIYTGREIQPYVLLPAKNYIFYDRANLQQVAKEEVYRAPEKLVYKFISDKLVFAYDDSASLFLNSANILIPDIPFMSIKAVLAFLNSSLFQFLYQKLFGEVKVLKGNLMELLFPEISYHDNERLTTLVDELLNGDDTKRKAIEEYIFSIYGLTDEQITYIRREINGKIN